MRLAVGKDGCVTQVHSNIHVFETLALNERAEDVGELDFGSLAEKLLQQAYDLRLGQLVARIGNSNLAAINYKIFAPKLNGLWHHALLDPSTKPCTLVASSRVR
jgi:hypothetical protein